VHFAGGIPSMFHQIATAHPGALTIHIGPNDRTWFVTNMLISAIGVAFMTLPHTWPALMSARDPKALRRNYTWLPLYTLCLMFPMIVGFAAIIVLPKSTSSNGILLTLSKNALPAWVTGLVVVAAIATAMVPSAGILIGISSLVARNIARVRDDRRQFWINHGTVVLATGLALLLGIFRPALLANLLLLTFSGTAQLAPANGLAFLKAVPVGKMPVLLGIVVGEAVVIWLTFWAPTLFGTFSVGMIGLGANVVVVVVVAVVERLLGRPSVPRAMAEEPAAV
jgi:SSS family solute:Na+ symporter